MLRCPPDDTGDMGWIENPTGVGLHAWRTNRQACAATFKRRESTSTLLDAMAIMRFPSFSVYPALFMMQNIVQQAFYLVMYDRRWWGKAFAFAAFVFTGALPPAVVADESAQRAPRWRVFLRGAAEWRSTRDPSYVRRYALCFKDFTHPWRRFLISDVAVIYTIACMSAFHPTNRAGCIARIAVVAAALFLHLAAIVAVRPFLVAFDQLFMVILLLAAKALWDLCIKVGPD
eukprot:gene19958-52045_t